MADLIRQSGCNMTIAEMGRTLPSNGFTPVEIDEVLDVLESYGALARRGFNGVSLTQQACTGQLSPTGALPVPLPLPLPLK